MSKIKFHNSFKLNRKSFSEDSALLNFSKTISEEVYEFLKQWFDLNYFVEVKTSGSTGKPKVIFLKKEFMKNSALATGTFFNLKENTSALLCMSPNYIAGKMMLVRALELGWHIDVVKPNSNPLKNVDKTYDFSAMVPLQLHSSLNEIHKINKLIVGGGVVSNELLSKIQDVKTEIFATYGMTETITHIAIKKLNCHSERSEESHYQLLPNIKISQDSRDCLIINAPKISEEEIVTNDIVKIISEKEFEWLGRFDTIINSGGVKLIPEQIEQKLSKIIDNRFFVYGFPDKVLGEKLVLIVEELVTERSRSDKKVKANAISTSLNHQNLNEKVKNLKTLSKFEQPKEVYFIPKFVETPTQKINRKETIQLL